MDIKIVLDAGGSDLPAWIQAIGSIAAILASGAFAVWVPLHLRRLEARDVVMRDQRHCVLATAHMLSVAKRLSQRAEAVKRLRGPSERLLRGEVAESRRLLESVGTERLSPEAISAFTDIRLSASVLEVATDNLSVDHLDAEIAATVLPLITDALADLRDAGDKLGKMRPRKAYGRWHLAMPKEQLKGSH